MSDIDLSEENVEKHCQAFARLPRAPSFSVSDDTDVNILFLKRKDKYFGIRTGLITDFKTRDEFLVYSVLVEKIGANIRNKLTLEHLKVGECSNELLEDIYKIGNRVNEHLPSISDVKHSCTVINNSELNWVFLEDGARYHSVFWNESESNVFSRCA